MNNEAFLKQELERLDRLLKINESNLKKLRNIEENVRIRCGACRNYPLFTSSPIEPSQDLSGSNDLMYPKSAAGDGDPQNSANPQNPQKFSYVRKSDLAPIKKLVQKQYEEKLNKALLANRTRLAKFIKNYDYDFVDQIYQKSAFARKQYISPIIEPKDDFIKDWLESHPGGQNPYDDPPELETQRGEFVRTKSEKILADTFYNLGIPYQYEPAFVLSNGYCKYPDFILLNVIHRKTYYWEHMGLTDEHGYATKNFRKLVIYERNGLVLGDNLILSLETEDMPLDMKMVQRKIQDYLL